MAARRPPAIATGSDGAVLVGVHVKPGARQSAVGPVDRWRTALEVQVKSRAEQGEANAELCQLLAAVLGIPGRQVTIVKGQRSRRKTVRIEGLGESAVRSALEAER